MITIFVITYFFIGGLMAMFFLACQGGDMYGSGKMDLPMFLIILFLWPFLLAIFIVGAVAICCHEAMKKITKRKGFCEDEDF